MARWLCMPSLTGLEPGVCRGSKTVGICVGGLWTAGGWDAEWLGAEATLLRMPSLSLLIWMEPGIGRGSEAVGFCVGGLLCVGGLWTAGGWDAEWLGAEATLLRMRSLLFLIRREPGIC
jgi:hypothetical protein